MSALPRVAIGTVQSDVDSQPILWGMLDALRQADLQVQPFLSRACFSGFHGIAAATGLTPRHLDSWLMSPRTCREIFLHGADGCDLAVVEGQFTDGRTCGAAGGGNLDVLCQWLDLPRLVILDVSRLETCRLPPRPAQADGLLLDRVSTDRHAAEVATNLEALWGIPVLGALEVLPELRGEIAGLPSGSRPSRDVLGELGRQFRRYARLDRVLELGCRREVAWDTRRLFAASQSAKGIVLAVAYDAAFDCYFQDTLDLLELRGATIVDFSPLQDERLPDRADVVCLGCGHAQCYSKELSHNHCMKLALRDHLCSGGRIYAEGGGLAYLCEYLETAAGECYRMAGILPAIARAQTPPVLPTPIELTLRGASWLGEPGTRLRGYRNPYWSFDPVGVLAGLAMESRHRYDLMGFRAVIGSQLHLDFAAQPQLLPRFFQPAEPGLADPWSVVP